MLPDLLAVLAFGTQFLPLCASIENGLATPLFMETINFIPSLFGYYGNIMLMSLRTQTKIRLSAERAEFSHNSID